MGLYLQKLQTCISLKTQSSLINSTTHIFYFIIFSVTNISRNTYGEVEAEESNTMETGFRDKESVCDILTVQPISLRVTKTS